MTDTWRFFRESRFGLRALHGYVYGRWPLRYVKTMLRLLKLGAPAFIDRKSVV